MPLEYSFAIVVLLCLALLVCLWFATFAPLFRSIHLLLAQKASDVLILCLFQSIAFSLGVMPPCHTPVSSAPVSTISVMTNAILISVKASDTPASASISPEFLASVIQAIQTPISAIIQRSLSATVSGAPSVSQGLPSLLLKIFPFYWWLPSTLALINCIGFGAVGSCWFLLLNSLTSTSPVPVAPQANLSTASMLLSLVVPSFVLLFSLATLSSLTPCSSVVYSLPATPNSAFASQPIESHVVIPSLTALPLQPFVVGPGYSPVPLKVVSQITVGKFMNLEDHYHSRARTATMVQWLINVVKHAQKNDVSDYRHALWMEVFFHPILCSSFPHQWRDLTSYKLLILQTNRQFSRFYWLDYNGACGLQKKSLTDLRCMLSFSTNASSKVISHSQNAGHCIAVNPQCCFHHVCSRRWGNHCASSCTSSQSSCSHFPDPEEPKRHKRH